jgi:uncharacterized protein YjiK
MLKTISVLSVVFFICNSCMQQEQASTVPGYDFSKPEILKMPAGLNEISGIAFNAGKPDTIYAIQDEEARLFYFSPGEVSLQNSKFGKKGDYEDLAICNGNVVVLRSDGTLFTFPLSAAYDGEVEQVQEFKDILPREEYEGLYADETTNELFVLCKTCSADNGKQVTVQVLQLNDSNQVILKRNFGIDTKQIAAQQEKKKNAFHPSALAKNKVSNEWFILSSVNKSLVILDTQWKVTNTISLDPKLFPQPEGIAFDRDNNLYISNERGNFAAATVLKFLKK